MVKSMGEDGASVIFSVIIQIAYFRLNNPVNFEPLNVVQKFNKSWHFDLYTALSFSYNCNTLLANTLNIQIFNQIITFWSFYLLIQTFALTTLVGI